MLSGDYQCFAYLAKDRGADPSCRLCLGLSNQSVTPSEDISHILTQCRATADTRGKYTPELLNTVAIFFPEHRILTCSLPNLLTQFMLDCSSLNLASDLRIPSDHPSFIPITRQCSVMIHSIHRDRCRQLKAKGLLK